MTQRVREGAKQVGKKNLNKTEAASLLSNIPRPWNTSTEQGIGVRKKEVGVTAVSGDRDFSRKGRKEGWSPTGQPRLSGQIQPAASPGSGCLHLLPSSGTGSTQQSQPA